MADDEVTVEKLQQLREEELVAFIRETVAQLNQLGDRLESYASDRTGSPEEHVANELPPA